MHERLDSGLNASATRQAERADSTAKGSNTYRAAPLERADTGDRRTTT